MIPLFTRLIHRWPDGREIAVELVSDSVNLVSFDGKASYDDIIRSVRALLCELERPEVRDTFLLERPYGPTN